MSLNLFFGDFGLEKELNHIEPDHVFDPAVSDNLGFVMLEKMDKLDDIVSNVGEVAVPEEAKSSLSS